VARFALMAMLAFAASPSSCVSPAQTPVPQGQPISKVTLSGTVQTTDGKMLAHTPITMRNLDDATVLSTTSGAGGDFSLKVRPGKYAITATADGFNETTKEVDILPGAAETVRLTVGGPVPGGEVVPHGAIATSHPEPGPPGQPATVALPPDVPMPATGAIAVSGVFSTWTDLAAWLNGQAGRNLRLQAILSLDGYKNIFVWVSHAGADQHIVIAASQMGTPDDLQGILKAYPQAAVIGSAWVRHDRFLVMRSNP